MAAIREGKVTALLQKRGGMVRLRVHVGSDEIDAVGFPSMLGPVAIGDRVVVNTTGIELALGSGGVGFVLWNLDGSGSVAPGKGHIVKMRYTPWQTEVMVAEAPESPHFGMLEKIRSIEGMPVVACGLHSQVPAVAAGIKAAAPSARVGYLMTDGAALPLAWSDNVAACKGAKLLDVTCTSGHAFGGDLESVNVFSGLAALKHVGRADVVIVAMGPGVVGTGSVLGFTGMEQGQILDAAIALEGIGIACLRINFADDRPRHRGVSHHSLAALQIAARERCTVVVPELPAGRRKYVRQQLEHSSIMKRHEVWTADGKPGIELLDSKGLKLRSMGRQVAQVPELFLAASAAGAVAAERI